MSLRVLLADESASIRKVFQMGLQDYGAEVKSIHNGLDVTEVAQTYKPHIIFADILLQKKNGYEVAQEISEHAELSATPVVLMWSSFMELDQSKYQSCKAKGELEKPFDVDKMRQLIQNLVQDTKSQQLSSFLSFPDNLTADFVEEEKQRAQNPQMPQAPQPVITPPPPAPSPSAEDPLSVEPPPSDFQFTIEDEPESDESIEMEVTSEFNIQAIENDPQESSYSEFTMYEVRPHLPPETPSTDQWEAKPLHESNLPSTPRIEDNAPDQFESMELNQEEDLKLDDFLYKPETPQAPEPTNPEVSMAQTGEIHNVQIPQYQNTSSATPQTPHISAEEMEAIIREETRQVLKTVIREQLPAIIEKVVKDELERILQQEMALKGMNPAAE
jgi:CheY-like chemotaxis protein